MLPETDPTLAPFFEPGGVVIIGVSANPTKLGYGIAQNLVNSGYPGAVHFVNPKGGRLFGRPVYTDISEIPDPVDLAVILVPPAVVTATLEACGSRGIKAAVIASGGFRETGQEGAELEEKCLAIARAHDMRLLGPNCIGLLDTHLPLDTTFLPPPAPPAGEIAFISHSGAICAAIVDWSRGQGFGFSRLVSLGNQADVTETDVLAHVAADPHTAVITLYLESISDGIRFVETARQITPHKPILALKVGRTEAGQKAAASHTGALAGSEAAFDAALRRAGIQRAATAEQLFDWARALAWSPTPDVGALREAPLHVAVLTNAGGPGVMAADAVEANGLTLATLANETKNQLRDLLAPAASVANPVDMLASASPEQYATSLRLLLADDGVDAVMVILPPPPMFSAGAVAREIIPLIQTTEKPVVIALMGYGLVLEALAFFRAVKIPTYTFPEPAASALAAVSKQYSVRGEQYSVNSEQHSVSSEKRIPNSEIRIPKSGWLPQDALFEMLAAYHIEVPTWKIVSSAGEVVAAADDIGSPVALKIAASDILHKSDLGGVFLNLRNADEVAGAFSKLAHIADEHNGSGPITADSGPPILVQQMVPQGQELIVGVTRDPQFGPLLMFGSGGVEIEGLGDVAFTLAPLTEDEAHRLLRETWAGRKLAGYRDIPPADGDAIIETILCLGRLVVDHPELAEIEINPLIALESGAIAVDIRARRV